MRWMLAMPCVCGVLLGCGGDPASSPPARPAETAPPPQAPPVDAGAAGEGAATAEGEPEPLPARRAEVGVGKKGHGYGTGPIGTPLAVRWRAAERLVFDVQIPHAMNLFKATNGRAPASHEEFMKQIIDLNQIDLPELPAGQHFQYDPATEQLMVYGPKPE